MTDFTTTPDGVTTPAFDPIALVADFIRAFEAPASVDLWLKLFHEERTELLEAMALNLTDGTVQSLADVLKEAADFLYVSIGLSLVLDKHGLEPTDASSEDVGDILAAVLGVFGEAVFEEGFRRVHESNMSKLGDDGKPVRREDGKVLKGPNYKPPVLTDLVTDAYMRSGATPSYLVRT
jgi:predicted HAD superfamily Cof-like phosphohydrolase